MRLATVALIGLVLASGGAIAAPSTSPDTGTAAAPSGSPVTTARPPATTGPASTTMGALPGTNMAGPAGGATFTSLADATKSCGSPGNVVWANTKTHVYHTRGDRDYGKTKEGTWMCMVNARKNGYRASGT